MPIIKYNLDLVFKKNFEKELNDKISSFGTYSMPNGTKAKLDTVSGKHYWAYSSPNDALDTAISKMALTFEPSTILDLVDTGTLSKYLLFGTYAAKDEIVYDIANDILRGESEGDSVKAVGEYSYKGTTIAEAYGVLKRDIKQYQFLLSETDSSSEEKAYYAGLKDCQRLLKEELIPKARGLRHSALVKSISKDMQGDHISYVLNHHPTLNSMEAIMDNSNYTFNSKGLAMWIIKQEGMGLGPTLAIDSIEHKIEGSSKTPWSVYRVE